VLRAVVRIDVEAELGGDHHLVPEGSQGFTHHLLVRERAIDFRGVEEGHAALDRRPDECDRLALVRCGTVAMAQSHAAEANGRDFEAAVAEFPCLHLIPPVRLDRGAVSATNKARHMTPIRHADLP
jgi:hypothetical protein